MRLCLTCRYLSPSEALFCPHCGRSFGGRRCPRGHLSPPRSVCCAQCGRTELSEPTAALRLGWLPRTLAWIAALLVLSWLFRHTGLVGGVASGAARWSFTTITGSEPASLWLSVKQMLKPLLFVLLLLYFIPGQAGRDLRRTLGHRVRVTCRFLYRMLTCLVVFRLLRQFVEGKRPFTP